MRYLLFICFFTFLFGGKLDKERAIEFEIEVNASIDKLWDTWTTSEGVKTFFAPDCKVKLDIYGEYEMYFVPDAPKGSKGGEGCKILAFQKNEFLTFTWNAPPHLPTVRNQKTVVIIRFSKINDNTTQLNFTHTGWGKGEEWDKAFEYFNKAWGDVVLPRLQKRFIEGPVNWNNK